MNGRKHKTAHRPADRDQQKPEHNGQAMGNGGGMVMAARASKRHHLAPAPGAADPLPNPFPPAVLRGLAFGALLGALLGLAAGWLLWNNILVVPGWEALYADGRFTFHVFWMFMGVAAGITAGGIGVMVVLAQRRSARSRHDQAPPTSSEHLATGRTRQQPTANESRRDSAHQAGSPDQNEPTAQYRAS